MCEPARRHGTHDSRRSIPDAARLYDHRIVDGDHDVITKEGNVVFFGNSDKIHGDHKIMKKGGNVFLHKD